jgi:hypothetical protein
MLDDHGWSRGEIHGLPLYVAANGLAFGERSLSNDKQAIAAAILDRSTDEVAPLALVVDRAAELRALVPVFEALGALEVRSIALVTRDEQDRVYSVPVQFRGTKSFDVALPERAPPLDAEPPPEDEPPPPSKKSGLYSMKGPKDAIPQMNERRGDTILLELDGTDVTLTLPGAEREQLTLEQLTELHERVGREVIELRVSDATPWSSVATLVTNACPLTLTLVHSSR